MKKMIFPGIMCMVMHAGIFAQAVDTYMNPVIPGDHPDCTISKIGDDFYTTGSSFNPTPVIYHSTDLVHWEAIARPINASWIEYGDAPGGGCWGGHVVYYKAKYWDFFGKSGTMYFVTATNIEGPWSMPTQMKCPSGVPGLGADNSIFIDTDSTWYLLVKNGQPNNWILQLGDDGQPAGNIFDLTWLNPSPAYPYSWAEGPVMWKYNGTYYYSFARDLSGGQKVMRSTVLTGEESSWELLGDFFNENDPLKSGSRFASPNHSSNVIMLDDSTSWIIHPLYAKGEWKGQGRQGLLNQVHYDANSRPVADYPVDKAFTAPDLPSSGIPWMVPKSDFFSSGKLNPEWSFLGRTIGSTYSLSDRPGWLHLAPKNSKKANTVIKYDGEHNYSLMIHVDFNAKTMNDEAGLRVMRGDETRYVKLYSTVNEYGHKVVAFSFDNTKYEAENTAGNTLWLKIIRVNHDLTGYFSDNAQDWMQVGRGFNVSEIDSYSDFVTFTGTLQGLYVKGNSSAYFDLYIYRDAYTPIMAECPANQYGTTRESSTDGIYVLDNIHNNDWAMYAGVEFGNREYAKASDSVQFIAASANDGSTVEIWLDSLETGTRIGTCTIGNTGSWNSYSTFSVKIDRITGIHDVFLKFSGGTADKLFKLKWMNFVSVNAPHYISSATTNDSTITVKIDKPVFQVSSPAGFTVTLNDTENDSITKADILSSDSSMISLRLKKNIVKTDEIRLSYGNGTVLCRDGLELVPFTDTLVDNLLPGSAPRIISVQTSIHGDSVIVRFNKAMKSPSPYAGDFKVTTDLSDNPIVSLDLKNDDSCIFILAIQQQIFYETSSTFDYTGENVKSADDGVLEMVTSLPVTNLSLGYPPVIQSTAVRKTGSLINVIVLKFNRPLADVSDQKDYFSLTENGEPAAIVSLTGNYDSIRFTVNPSFEYSDIIKMSYSGGSVASTHGGRLAYFSDYPVASENPAAIRATEIRYESTIRIYPNPVTNSELIICSKDEFDAVSVFDMEGRLLITKNFNASLKSISLFLDLNRGTYILKLNGRSGPSYAKLVFR
jgi:xylan 1,4-beta-xylosidase